MTTDTLGRRPRTVASSTGGPNLFVYYRPNLKNNPRSLFSSTGLDEIEARLTTTRVKHGVSYFNARRELWLNGKKKIPRSSEVPTSITRLEEMVRDPRALRSNTVWEAGLGRVSNRLIEGGRLKYNLPMHLLVSNTIRSAHAFSVDGRVSTDKDPVRRLDSRWNMATRWPGPRV